MKADPKWKAVVSDLQELSTRYIVWEVLDPEGKPFAWGSRDFCERFSKTLNEGPVFLPN